MNYVEQMQKQWLCENRWHVTCGYASPAKQKTQILKQYIFNLEDTKVTFSQKLSGINKCYLNRAATNKLTIKFSISTLIKVQQRLKLTTCRLIILIRS
ncbi:hypothetical protein HanXRQr2_Chr12g0565111 [Helianthus annuus]|uniref:Uncharacterized protein n=1 Tax=Helianthus annuus TaxID=4232 RepID=A0A9K3HKJ0_HELAN|nr:hypothetical protein HanXRQr2_Chr12g0565111 [Helianthus annuus]KAJ0864652.1 hypothetical protein HanPSC8_Chr12g0544411 [Helianthus annuus]